MACTPSRASITSCPFSRNALAANKRTGSSSSTNKIRMVLECLLIDGTWLILSLSITLFWEQAGKYRDNVVPNPRDVSTVIPPFTCSIICNTLDSPNPVPCPGSLVEKKGSKIRSTCWASMPIPVSLMSITT